MKLHSVFVFTHDSIGLGQDGPTHQPVEHLMALRATPHMVDFRPADANETSAAWGVALEETRPFFMALSRQNLPVLDPEKHKVFEGAPKGAYIVEQGTESPDILIVATGSELWPALDGAAALKKDGVNARVVSMPSFRRFEDQSEEYKRSIFPDHLPKLAVEAGASLGWWKYVGAHGDVIGLDHFGASAPGSLVLKKLGFSAENVASRAKALLERSKTEMAGASR